MNDYWDKPSEDECPACEGTGNAAVHGLDPATCRLCNGTGKFKFKKQSEEIYEWDEND